MRGFYAGHRPVRCFVKYYFILNPLSIQPFFQKRYSELNPPANDFNELFGILAHERTSSRSRFRFFWYNSLTRAFLSTGSGFLNLGGAPPSFSAYLIFLSFMYALRFDLVGFAASARTFGSSDKCADSLSSSMLAASRMCGASSFATFTLHTQGCFGDILPHFGHGANQNFVSLDKKSSKTPCFLHLKSYKGIRAPPF